MDIQTAQIATVEMEIEIDASPDKVWAALTENIGSWWPEDFFAGGQPGQRRYHLEPVPGGRMYEEWSTGGGLTWASVMTVEPNKLLQVLGHQFPNWGGPSQWYGTWTLEEKGDGTRLHFSDCAMGRVTKEGLKDKDAGWRFLWQTLKAHVEGMPLPEWPA